MVAIARVAGAAHKTGLASNEPELLTTWVTMEDGRCRSSLLVDGGSPRSLHGFSGNVEGLVRARNEHLKTEKHKRKHHFLHVCKIFWKTENIWKNRGKENVGGTLFDLLQ